MCTNFEEFCGIEGSKPSKMSKLAMQSSFLTRELQCCSKALEFKNTCKSLMSP